jgi:hypothetical protein
MRGEPTGLNRSQREATIALGPNRRNGTMQASTGVREDEKNKLIY